MKNTIWHTRGDEGVAAFLTPSKLVKIMSAPKAPCTFAKSGGGLEVQLFSRARYRSGRFLEVILGTETEAFFDVGSRPPFVSIWYPFGSPLGTLWGAFGHPLGPKV